MHHSLVRKEMNMPEQGEEVGEKNAIRKCQKIEECNLKVIDLATIVKLTLQCIGVVYGDLGTSPLYTFELSFPKGIKHNDDILGILSIIVWSFTLITMIKYVFVALLRITTVMTLFWPMFVLAVLSAVIASQSLITTAFSIGQHAIALGCFPWVKVVYTSFKFAGQVYIPVINHTLMVVCVLIFRFKIASAIANAYGRLWF